MARDQALDRVSRLPGGRLMDRAGHMSSQYREFESQSHGGRHTPRRPPRTSPAPRQHFGNGRSVRSLPQSKSGALQTAPENLELPQFLLGEIPVLRKIASKSPGRGWGANFGALAGGHPGRTRARFCPNATRQCTTHPRPVPRGPPRASHRCVPRGSTKEAGGGGHSMTIAGGPTGHSLGGMVGRPSPPEPSSQHNGCLTAAKRPLNGR